jgi:hypothetical protein
MISKRSRIVGVVLVASLFTLNVLSQNKFDGIARNNGDYCVVGTGDVVVKTKDVNNNLVNATGLSQCSGITGVGINGNVVTPRSGDRYFCFSGLEQNYYLTIGTNPAYKWLAENLRSTEGIYDLEEFGASRDSSINNTYPIKNAIVYIGTRPESGGKLKLPNGIFKVDSGTLPSTQPNNVSDSLPIFLPPGIALEGTNGKSSYSSSRIQVEQENKTIFKIGGCTNFVTIRHLGLVTPLIAVGNPPQYEWRSGTKAIYAEGAAPNSSHHFVFSGLTIEGFEEGIRALGTDPNHDWQFDNINLENSNISGCRYPVRNGTNNSNWQISNTTINTMNNVFNTIRGVGILIERGGGIYA